MPRLGETVAVTLTSFERCARTRSSAPPTGTTSYLGLPNAPTRTPRSRSFTGSHPRPGKWSLGDLSPSLEDREHRLESGRNAAQPACPPSKAVFCRKATQVGY